MKDDIKDIIIESLKEAFDYASLTFSVLLFILGASYLLRFIVKLFMVIPYTTSMIGLIVIVFIVCFIISFIRKYINK